MVVQFLVCLKVPRVVDQQANKQTRMAEAHQVLKLLLWDHYCPLWFPPTLAAFVRAPEDEVGEEEDMRVTVDTVIHRRVVHY